MSDTLIGLLPLYGAYIIALIVGLSAMAITLPASVLVATAGRLAAAGGVGAGEGGAAGENPKMHRIHRMWGQDAEEKTRLDNVQEVLKHLEWRHDLKPGLAPSVRQLPSWQVDGVYQSRHVSIDLVLRRNLLGIHQRSHPKRGKHHDGQSHAGIGLPDHAPPGRPLKHRQPI